MTREEAVTVLKAFMENPLFSDAHKQAFNIAIHDIKQRHDWDINKLMLVPKTEWEQEPIEKCKWIKYDYRTMCPKEHIDVDNPYWRIPESRMETLKYCPYCGKEIEVEE